MGQSRSGKHKYKPATKLAQVGEAIPKKGSIQKNNAIGYFGGLDILRFICALGVVFHHEAETLLKHRIISGNANSMEYVGAFCVNTFFIISGFLISFILMKEFKNNSFSLKNFYMRRIIRIWPLYFLTVFVMIFLIPLINGMDWSIIKSNLLYAATFTVNFQLLLNAISKTYVVLWSVCIEEHIYLLLPLLLFLFKGKFKSLAAFLIGTGLFSWIYFLHVQSKSDYLATYFVSSSYFYYFGIGTLIACMYNRNDTERKAEKYIFNPIVQVVMMLVFFPYVLNLWGSHGFPTPLFFYALFGGYLVWAATQPSFIFKLKPIYSRYLGNISYGLYLVHIWVVVTTFKMLKHTGVGITFWKTIFPCIALLASVGIATLLYYSFEKPILKLKAKFTTVASK